MNLQQVRYFLAVCKERNFTRAAKSCRISQPSLTSAIQRLEREVGGKLFVRCSPTQLSALGKELRPWFLRISQAAERAQQIAARYTRAPRSLAALSRRAEGQAESRRSL